MLEAIAQPARYMLTQQPSRRQRVSAAGGRGGPKKLTATIQHGSPSLKPAGSVGTAEMQWPSHLVGYVCAVHDMQAQQLLSIVHSR
jgi:hypothetical protein